MPINKKDSQLILPVIDSSNGNSVPAHQVDTTMTFSNKLSASVFGKGLAVFSDYPGVLCYSDGINWYNSDGTVIVDAPVDAPALSEVQTILHISGSDGLVYDANGGALTNASTGAKTVRNNYDTSSSYVQPTLTNEIRYKNARRINNIVTFSSEGVPTLTSGGGCTPNFVSNVDLPANAPGTESPHIWIVE